MKSKPPKSNLSAAKKNLIKDLKPKAKASIKPKITCLGCNRPWTNKAHEDGSYHHFYQDLKTKQYFCSNCVQNEPLEEPLHHVIWRKGKYLNRQGQELCA